MKIFKNSIFESYNDCNTNVFMLAAKCDLLRDKIKKEKDITAGYYLRRDLHYSEIAYHNQIKECNDILMNFDSKKFVNKE